MSEPMTEAGQRMFKDIVTGYELDPRDILAIEAEARAAVEREMAYSFAAAYSVQEAAWRERCANAREDGFDAGRESVIADGTRDAWVAEARSDANNRLSAAHQAGIRVGREEALRELREEVEGMSHTPESYDPDWFCGLSAVIAAIDRRLADG